MQKLSFRKQAGLILIVFMILCSYFQALAQEEKGRAYYDFGVFAYEDGDYEGAEKNRGHIMISAYSLMKTAIMKGLKRI